MQLQDVDGVGKTAVMADAEPGTRTKRTHRLTGTVAALLWVAAGAVAALQAVRAFLDPRGEVLADLHVYYGAVKALYRDGSLYGYVAANGDPFTYPPFAGLVLSPLILVPEPVAGLLWTAITVALVGLAAWVVARRLEAGRTQAAIIAPAAILAPAIALALILSAPLVSNIRFGQVSWLLVVLVGVDALAIAPARFRGVATGIAAAVKLTPLIFIPYYWFSGRRREAVVGTATFAGCTALGWLILPADTAHYWLTAIWHTDRIGDLAMPGNQSMNGILLRLGVPTDVKTITLGLLSLVVVVLGLRRAARAARNGDELAGLAITGAVAVAVTPVSWTHHQVWLLLAAVVALGHPGWDRWWPAAVLAVMILPVGGIAAALPAVAEPFAENLRGLLAVAIAVALPFTSTRPRTGCLHEVSIRSA
jgi:alpha-1,2-mannosyltransferase